MKNIRRRYDNTARRECLAQAQKLRRIPQRTISAYETLSCAILPFLLIMCGAMPSSALFIMPISLCLLFVLYRRFGLYFPIACVIGYGTVSLAINYDILTVIYALGLLFGLCGLVLALQFPNYLACAVISAVVAIMGALAGVGIVRLAENKPIAEIAAAYVVAEREDPLIGYFSQNYYKDLKLPPDIEKLEPTDPDYELAAAQSFGEWAEDEFGEYAWYYCIHFGTVFGIVGYMIALWLAQRTASCYDFATSPERAAHEADKLKNSTRALGGICLSRTPVREMRMPRSYLWACVLPTAVVGIVLEIIGGYDYLSATLMHLFVTLPSAFACFTLLVFFVTLFKGKARIAASIVLCLIGVVAVLFPIALFVLSLVGVSDCIINIRFWTKFIMSD